MNPRLNGGVKLCSSCSSPWPCQSTQACSANAGAEILYNSATSANGCQEIWSMNTTGGNKIDLTAKMLANGFGHGPALNQGTPTYSPDGQWMIFPAQSASSAYACSAHAVAPGAALDSEIDVCDTATYSNCAVIRTVTAGTGHGSLHPQITRDGGTLYWGAWMGTPGTTPEGDAGALQWANFIPGTPPSLGAIHSSDFLGDGTNTKNWYEPADSDGAIGTPTCWIYVTTDNTIVNPTRANVAIARYSLGGGTTCPSAGTFNFVSAPYETPPGCYSEFWSFNQRLDWAITITSCFFTGAPSPPAVLDIAMAMGSSGTGAIQLTGYNLAGQPEYQYPTLVSNPHPAADASYIVFNLVTNAVLQGQAGGFGGATGSSIWKYNVNLVPSQVIGRIKLDGQAEYK